MKIRKIFIFLIFLLFPIAVMALDSKTGELEISKMKDSFSTGSVVFSNLSFTYFNNYNNTGTGGFVVNSNIHNYYEQDVKIKTVLKIYDVNKKVLDIEEKAYDLLKDGDSAYEIGKAVYPATNGYSIDMVKYYSLDVEIITDVVVKKESDELNKDYYLEKYDTKIKVNKKRQVSYDETLSVNFEKSKNYFYRKIYVNNKVDGYVNDLAVISDIAASEKYEVSLKDGYQILKMSDDASPYSGIEKFNIKFIRDLGEDLQKNQDILYINIVDKSWDISTKIVSYEIELPELIKNEKINFVIDGKIVNEKVDYKIVGNKIVGTYENLKANQNLAILVDFKDNYFTKENSLVDWSLKLMMFGPLILLLIALIFVFVLIRKKDMSRKIKYEDIKLLNILETSYIYHGQVSSNDLALLVLELCNEGYLKVTEKNDSIELIRAKKYRGSDEVKQILMNELFIDNNTINEETIFYKDWKALGKIKRLLEEKRNLSNKYFNKYIFIIILSIISLLIISIRPVIVFDDTAVIWGPLISVVSYVAILLIFLSNYALIEKLLASLCVLILYGIGMYFFIIPAVFSVPIYIMFYLLGVFCNFVMLILYMLMPKRTHNANKILKDLNKFKYLLTKNTLDRINVILKTDLSFYDILPYIYVFEINEQWDKRAKNVASPEWLLVENEDVLKSLKDIYGRLSYAFSQKGNS